MAKAKTEIQINEQWKIVKSDALNWQPFEWREIENKSGAKRAGEFDWMASGHFFGQLSPALRWIAEQQVDNGEKMTMQEAVSRIETSNLKLMRDIEKALKAVSE